MSSFVIVFFGFYLVQSYPLDEYYVNYESSPTGQSYVYRYQPQASYREFRSDINKPMYVPELGMKPEYHNLVFNYVKSFGGTEPPTFVNAVQPSNYYVPSKIISNGDETVQNSNIVQSVVDRAGIPIDPTVGTVMTKPQVNKYVLPSDISALPKSQIRGNVQSVKMKKIKGNSRVTSLPPIGGVVSDYVLLRNQPNYQNLLKLPLSTKKNDASQIKRETSEEDDDSVVIFAEPLKNIKNNEKQIERKEEEEEEEEEMKKMNERDEGEEKQELQPSIAQSKPSAIALAGPGGVAQASPMGTAVVGHGGLAVSAPSGTAIAGSTGKGAIPIFIGNEKKKSIKNDSDSDSDDEDSRDN